MDRFIPISEPCLEGNEQKYLAECVKTGWVSSVGSFVTDFQESFARYIGVKHAVATCSGTSALHTALNVLGVGSGDEVLVPTVTFIAPVNAVRYTVAEPVFIDTDEHMNMSPELLAGFLQQQCTYDGTTVINKHSGCKVKAIIVVHIFGHPAQMEPIIDIADKFGLPVVEDTAEAHGSKYTSGKYAGMKAGSMGTISCFSFNGNKIITSGGGGMLMTNDEKLAEHAKALSTQAKSDPIHFIHNEVGYNYRMTNIEAALGLAQLEQLEGFLARKRRAFDLYSSLFKDAKSFKLIAEPQYARSNYWLYCIELNSTASLKRDAIIEAMQKRGIQCRPLWVPNHKQLPYKDNQAILNGNADKWFESVLNIPSSVGLSDGDIERVAGEINSLLA